MGSLSTTFNKSIQKKFFLFKYFYQVVNMRNVFLFLLILLAIFSTIEAGSKACKITKLKVAIFGCKSLCNYCHKYYGGKAKCLKVCKQKPCPSTTTTATTTNTTANTTKTSPTTNTTSKNPKTTKKTTVITKIITVKANITTTNTKKSSANTKKSTATTLNGITRTTKSAANSTKILLTKKISATTKKPKAATKKPKKSTNKKTKVTISNKADWDEIKPIGIHKDQCDPFMIFYMDISNFQKKYHKWITLVFVDSNWLYFIPIS